MKRHNDYKLSEILGKLQQEPKLEPKLILEKVKDFWAHELGEYIPRQTKELDINHHKLFVRIDSSTLKDELRFKKSALIARINEYLGQPYLEDMVIH